MYIPNDKDGSIFIIGNSDDKDDIQELIKSEDIVVRFNKPNPSCSLKADVLFVANGIGMVIHQDQIYNGLLKPDCKVIWRYHLKDVLASKFQKISLMRKLRYLLLFDRFKKMNQLTKYEQVTLNFKIYETCFELLNAIPSSGFLAVYLYASLYADRKIYLHNFTYTGWLDHNWEGEKLIIERLAREDRVILLDPK